MKICQQRKLCGVTNRLLNRCLTKQTVELIDSFTDANDTLNQCGKWKRLDDHLSSIDFGIYLYAIFHSVFTFMVQSPQNLRSNPYNRKSENGS